MGNRESALAKQSPGPAEKISTVKQAPSAKYSQPRGPDNAFISSPSKVDDPSNSTEIPSLKRVDQHPQIVSEFSNFETHNSVFFKSTVSFMGTGRRVFLPRTNPSLLPNSTAERHPVLPPQKTASLVSVFDTLADYSPSSVAAFWEAKLSTKLAELPSPAVSPLPEQVQAETGAETDVPPRPPSAPGAESAPPAVAEVSGPTIPQAIVIRSLLASQTLHTGSPIPVADQPLQKRMSRAFDTIELVDEVEPLVAADLPTTCASPAPQTLSPSLLPPVAEAHVTPPRVPLVDAPTALTDDVPQCAVATAVAVDAPPTPSMAPVDTTPTIPEPRVAAVVVPQPDASEPRSVARSEPSVQATAAVIESVMPVVSALPVQEHPSPTVAEPSATVPKEPEIASILPAEATGALSSAISASAAARAGLENATLKSRPSAPPTRAAPSQFPVPPMWQKPEASQPPLDSAIEAPTAPADPCGPIISVVIPAAGPMQMPKFDPSTVKLRKTSAVDTSPTPIPQSLSQGSAASAAAEAEAEEMAREQEAAKKEEAERVLEVQRRIAAARAEALKRQEEERIEMAAILTPDPQPEPTAVTSAPVPIAAEPPALPSVPAVSPTPESAAVEKQKQEEHASLLPPELSASQRRNALASQQQRVEAIYAFEAREEREISLQAGDTLVLVSRTGDWWLGERSDGKRGYFPANYVKLLPKPKLLIKSSSSSKILKLQMQTGLMDPLAREDDSNGGASAGPRLSAPVLPSLAQPSSVSVVPRHSAPNLGLPSADPNRLSPNRPRSRSPSPHRQPRSASAEDPREPVVAAPTAGSISARPAAHKRAPSASQKLQNAKLTAMMHKRRNSKTPGLGNSNSGRVDYKQFLADSDDEDTTAKPSTPAPAEEDG